MRLAVRIGVTHRDRDDDDRGDHLDDDGHGDAEAHRCAAGGGARYGTGAIAVDGGRQPRLHGDGLRGRQDPPDRAGRRDRSDHLHDDVQDAGDYLVLPVSIAATVMAGLNWPPETRPSIAVTTAYANAVPTTMYARSSP